MKNIFLVFLILLQFSCSSLIGGLTESLTNSLYQQKDIELIEEGAPAFLLIIESFIESNPGDKKQLVTGIQAFSAYSSAFVTEPKRKRIFSEKTKQWAMKLLRTYPQFVKYESTVDIDKKEVELNKFLNSINKKEVPYIFWAANAWVMWILDNLDSMDAFIELPVAKEIIGRVRNVDGEFYYGAPYLFYGVYYSAFPEDFGGNLVKAKEEFDIALKLSGDKLLTTKLLYATFYLKAIGDKKEFERILNEIIDCDIEKYPETRLLNVITRNQAEIVLEKIDEMFFSFD